MDSQLVRMETKIDRLQSDLTNFNAELGRHDQRLEHLERPDRPQAAV
jgi:hypothetical protein